MIRVTRLDGVEVFINETNIQWIEAMPDTAITFLGGSRMILRDKIDEVLMRIRDVVQSSENDFSRSAGASGASQSRAHLTNRTEEGPRA